ncbi:MAG: hypothetical protein ACODAQ_06680 [Phycisphaeraceae bacterium]
MHIDLRDERRRPLFAVDVDLAAPPAIVHAPGDNGTSVHLDWDRALDDEHHLRHCPACGCRELFVRKPMPQVTVFVIILLVSAIAMLLYGQVNPLAALIGFAVLAVVDIAIYLFTRRELVCYRCHSAFSGMPIRRDHPRWDRARAERYEPPEEGEASQEDAAATDDTAPPVEPPQRERDGASTP